MGAYFFSDNLLGNNLVAQVLFEVFVGDALGRGRFFQVLHRVQVHLLAHLVQSLHQFCVGRYAQVFALVKQQLLIDEIAQHIFLLYSEHLVRLCCILLLQLLFELLPASQVFRARDDLIVYASDDLLNYGICSQDYREGEKTSNQRKY